MKCDPNDHRIVLAVDGTVFCKNCPQKWSPEQPSTERKESHDFEVNSVGLGVCKKCGTHQTNPQWPPYCQPKPKCACTKESCPALRFKVYETAPSMSQDYCACECHGEKKEEKPCEGCEEARTSKEKKVCGRHWVMPSSEWVDSDGNPVSPPIIDEWYRGELRQEPKILNHGPCAFCGKNVEHAYPWWTKNPEKGGRPVCDSTKCKQKLFDGEPSPQPPKEESCEDKSTRRLALEAHAMIISSSKEEREWRKEVADILEALAYKSPMLRKDISDLRERFL